MFTVEVGVGSWGDECLVKRVKVQFGGLNLLTNQVTASDKVNLSAIFKSANGKITSICIIWKIH